MTEIKDGIPLPATSRTITDRWPFKKMEVGQCVDFAEADQAAQSYAYLYGKKFGKKFTVRMIRQDGGRIMRIWRVK